jgi:hypothetical protein
MEGYTTMTAESATFFEKGADHPYLRFENARSDDAAPQVNELKEAGTARCAVASSRFAIATNLVLFSLLAFVPGTQAVHLLHKTDASFSYKDFHASAAAGLFVSTGIDDNRRSLGTPDTTFKEDPIIWNLSARSSMSTAIVTDKSVVESRVPGINAKPRLNSSSGEAKSHRASLGETDSMVRTIYILHGCIVPFLDM